eukprot:CAMPEP_0183328804 /NCGR_PEP_ID=MMETSP0160_2-20130417/84472_1 /TAXON_ID=2839 ORGANISM="Odontella Sinensis, Strain Grunow 1884" /NCGR_SAMPLE_ID=MMETSP0160_2 /ASSEMBLY_ACC=CAM_ASM_000250 /LENGTH=1022 /DNA_ID=CAMNT_0025496981 /DNA_START=1 /DNA_END=3069 /DNA_ORIENTATION=+
MQEVAQYVPEGSKRCLDFSLAAMKDCGCEYTPPPDTTCRLCADDTELPDPFKELIMYEWSASCAKMEWELSFHADPSDDKCLAYQALAGDWCGCEPPHSPPCEITCPEGMTVDLYKQVDYFRMEYYQTCAWHMLDLSTEPEACDEEAVSYISSECCEPPPPPCGLCPEGTEVQFPDEIADFRSGETCTELHERLAAVPPGYECDEARSELLYGGGIAKCGYCVPSEGASVCTLCPDGSVPNFSFDTFSSLPNFSFDAFSSLTDYTYCGNLYNDALINLHPESQKCQDFQSKFGPVCGCPTSKPTCRLCPDGNGDIPFVDGFSSVIGLGCGEMQQMSLYIPDKHEHCLDLSIASVLECGCEYIPPPDTTCSICNDVDLPDPSLSIDPYVSYPDLSTSCAFIEWNISELLLSDDGCTAAQAVYGKACNCPSPPQPACDVTCPDGTALNLAMETYLFMEDEYVTNTCAGLLWELSTDPILCTDAAKSDLALQCCSRPPPPPRSCSICPPGMNLTAPDTIFNDAEGDTTCLDFDRNLAMLPYDSCSLEMMELQVDPPDQCGYCVGRSKGLCTLCWDGSEPTESAELETPFGRTCGQLAFAMLIDYDGSEMCSSMQNMLWSFCGCPQPDGVDPVEGTCGLCPEGMLLEFPNAIFNETTDETCADLEKSLELIPPGPICEMTVSLLGFPSQCGYCVPSSPESVLPDICTLCPDGSTPSSDANTVIPFAEDGSTCGEAAFYAAMFSAMLISGGEYEACAIIQETIGQFCGCAIEGPTCVVCPDGSGGVPNPEAYSELFFEMSCIDVQNFAQSSPADSMTCISATVSAIFECGCEYVPPPQNDDSCTLCADGSVVQDPYLTLASDVVYETCGSLEWMARFVFVEDFSEEDCSAIQATYGAMCGCKNPPLPACDPQCSEGTTFDFTRTIPFDGNETICGDALFELSMYLEGCDAFNVGLLRQHCCAVSPGIPSESPSIPSEAPSTEDDGDIKIESDPEGDTDGDFSNGPVIMLKGTVLLISFFVSSAFIFH